MRVTAVIFVCNPPQWGFPFQSLTLWPLIRLVTRSRWNHVAMLTDKGVVVEALGGGVKATGLAEWRTRAVRQTEFVAVDTECGWLESVIGIPYDYASLLLWKLLKMATGRWFGPVWKDAKKAVTCSELAAMVLGIAEPWQCTPQELYEYLKTNQKSYTKK